MEGSDSIDACQDILNSRGWVPGNENGCTTRDATSAWRMELARDGQVITVEAGTPLKLWQQAVEMTNGSGLPRVSTGHPSPERAEQQPNDPYAVTINEISKACFDMLVETSPPLGHSSAEERAWFASSGNGVLGTVIHDGDGKSWAYAVLMRLADGRFGWAHGSVCHSEEHATAQLKEAMARRDADPVEQ